MPLLDVRSACPYTVCNPRYDEVLILHHVMPCKREEVSRKIEKKGVAVTSIQLLLLLLVLKSRTTVTIVGDTSPVAGMLRRLWDAVIFL